MIVCIIAVTYRTLSNKLCQKNSVNDLPGSFGNFRHVIYVGIGYTIDEKKKPLYI